MTDGSHGPRSPLNVGSFCFVWQQFNRSPGGTFLPHRHSHAPDQTIQGAREMKHAVAVAVALTFVGACPSLAQAENAVLSWSSAAVDNLAISMTDLRPQDGLPAGLTSIRGSTDLVAIEVYADRGRPDYAGRSNYQTSLFSPFVLDAKTPGQEAVSRTDATGLKSEVKLTSNAFDDPVKSIAFFDPTYPGTIGPGRSAWVRSEERFSLAAGSEVTLSGSIHLASALNLDSLAGMPWLSELGSNKSVLATAQARSEIELKWFSAADQIEVITEGLSSSSTYCCNRILSASNTTEQYLGAWGVGDVRSLPGQTDPSFQYVLRNNGNAAIEFSLSVTTRSTFGATVTAVPEASAWAMSLVGLLALMPIWARRRA